MIKNKNIFISIFLILCTGSSTKAEKFLTLKHVKDSNWSLKASFIEELVSLFEPDVLIESGTYTGNTIANALPYFKELYSVELAPQIYASACTRFRNAPNVHLYQGDSSEVFTKILPTIPGKKLFWLDGHYSGGSTAKGSKNTPIINELESIKKSGLKNAVILVDDIRCFEPINTINKDRSLLGYPSVQELRSAIFSINPNYHFIIYGDIAIAYIKENVMASPVIEACTLSRLVETESDDVFPSAEKVIASAEGEEKETLKNLPEIYSQFEFYGLGRHFRLWKGLILEQEGNKIEAIKNFQKALYLGYPEKHISQYLYL